MKRTQGPIPDTVCKNTGASFIRINAVKIGWILYIMMGLFAAMAGIARASYMSLGDPLSGDGFLERDDRFFHLS